jgi:protein SCO1/2
MFRIALIFFGSLYFFISCKEKRVELKLPYYNTAEFSPIFINDIDSVPIKIDHTIGVFNLKDQHNISITEKAVEGKIHIANFFFTGCGSICPGMMNKMRKVNSVFADANDVVFLSFSVTPWRDDVNRLNEYATLNQIIANNWHLLTGTRNEIYDLARRSYFAEEQLGFSKDSTDFLHTEHVLLVDKTGRIRGIYNGTLEMDMDQLKEDIFQLKKEN